MIEDGKCILQSISIRLNLIILIKYFFVFLCISILWRFCDDFVTKE